MKSLYESILGSTKSGKMQIIKDWCEENISTIISGDSKYEIDNDGKIIPNYRGGSISLSNWNGKPIPSVIKFGDFGKGSFFSDIALTGLKNEQLPDNCSTFYISGKIETIPSRKIKTQFGISLNEYPIRLKKIENLEIECSTLNGRRPIIDLSYSSITLKDVLNITVIGDIYKLNIAATPAAKELLKIFKKCEKKSDPDTFRGIISSELEELFKNFPELRYIQVSSRTLIEHNPKTDRWYKI